MKKEELKLMLYTYKIKLHELENVEKSLKGKELKKNLWEQVELLEKIIEIEDILYN